MGEQLSEGESNLLMNQGCGRYPEPHEQIGGEPCGERPSAAYSRITTKDLSRELSARRV